ncbi:MAG: hypothetical protein LBN34_09875 [Clostridiales Family XIII bacterium]|nr:hypothetical protein [Clostridiales Family XIII bacterium]
MTAVLMVITLCVFLREVFFDVLKLFGFEYGKTFLEIARTGFTGECRSTPSTGRVRPTLALLAMTAVVGRVDHPVSFAATQNRSGNEDWIHWCLQEHAQHRSVHTRNDKDDSVIPAAEPESTGGDEGWIAGRARNDRAGDGFVLVRSNCCIGTLRFFA